MWTTFLIAVLATIVDVGSLPFVGTALWLERPRLRLVPLACAVGFVAYLIVAVKPYQLFYNIYSDAPGLAIVQMANRNLAFDSPAVMWMLYATLAIAVALLLLPRVLERRRLPGGAAVGGVVVALVVAWNLAGQIHFANGSNSFARKELGNLPAPANWLDRLDGGQPAIYLGQGVQDPTGVNLLEFWNRSLHYVWSLDGTAPGPGPILTPDLAATNGRLFPDPGVRWVVADPGVDIAGQLVAQKGRWTLYRLSGPLRLAHSQTGILADGWNGCSPAPCTRAEAAYNRFASPGGRPGYAIVSVSRAAAQGAPIKPGHVIIRLGTLVRGSDRQPGIGHVTAFRRWIVAAGAHRTFTIPTPRPPFRIEVSVSPTFSPSDYGSFDRRELGAQLGFDFRTTLKSRR